MRSFDHLSRFHVVDTETAGFKPFDHGGGVCEISIREVCPLTLETLVEHKSMLNPEGPIHPTAAGIHGISDEQVVDKPTLVEWLVGEAEDVWSEDKEPVWFIAYNADFDYNFLGNYMDCQHEIADILVLTRRYYPEAPDHKMATLRFYHKLNHLLLPGEEYDGDEPFDAHSASGDTKILARLIYRLMLDTGMSLQELCIDSQKVDPIINMPFGKFKGMNIDRMKKEESDYVKWVLKNLNLKPDLRRALGG